MPSTSHVSPSPTRARATAVRRSAITDAALELFVLKGVATTTIEEIRERSGASVGSIYHHFGSKEELAAEIYVGGMRDYQEGFLAELAVSAVAEDAVKGVVHRHLAWVEASADLARFLFAHREPELVVACSQPLRQANRSFMQAVNDWLARQAAEGAIKDLAEDLYYSLWIAPTQDFAQRWLLGQTRTTIASAAEALAQAAWESLCSPSPRRHLT